MMLPICLFILVGINGHADIYARSVFTTSKNNLINRTASSTKFKNYFVDKVRLICNLNFSQLQLATINTLICHRLWLKLATVIMALHSTRNAAFWMTTFLVPISRTRLLQPDFEEMNKIWIKPDMMYHVWHRLIHRSIYVILLQCVVY